MRLKLRVEVAGPSQDHAPEKRPATLALRDLTLTFLVEIPSTYTFPSRQTQESSHCVGSELRGAWRRSLLKLLKTGQVQGANSGVQDPLGLWPLRSWVHPSPRS
jgi:hypothetical protein